MVKSTARLPVLQVVPVTVEMCNIRHQNLDKNIDEIVRILRGSGELDNMGLVGEIRDLKRDKKWTYALLTMIVLPVVFLLVEFLMKGG